MDDNNFDDESVLGGLLQQVPRERREEYIDYLAQTLGEATKDFLGKNVAPPDATQTAQVNSIASSILLEAGVRTDPDDPLYKKLVAPHTTGDPASYLAGIRQYANARSRGGQQSSLMTAYQIEMREAEKRHAGAQEKILIRQKHRGKGLEI
jgi:hypothetical protein